MLAPKAGRRELLDWRQWLAGFEARRKANVEWRGKFMLEKLAGSPLEQDFGSAHAGGRRRRSIDGK
jgi:hypothetical protein